MKRLLLTVGLLAFVGSVVPQAAEAQWTNPYQNYQMNDLIRRTPKKKQTVRKIVRKSSTAKPVKVVKKTVPQKKRS